jgi:hypothetical protein
LTEKLLLLQKIKKPVKKRRKKPPKSRPELLALINRVEMRRWLGFTEQRLMMVINDLRGEVKFIEHLPRCKMCIMLLKLDIERYLGNRSTWYLCLENNEYLEEEYPDCPKEENYHIGSYWEQLKHYEKYGNTDVPGENTEQFIVDRAKWAYKIIGKQIHVARQMLRLVRTWNFSDEYIIKFNRLEDELGFLY